MEGALTPSILPLGHTLSYLIGTINRPAPPQFLMDSSKHNFWTRSDFSQEYYEHGTGMGTQILV
jgi:hypothetical protein